MSGEGSSQADSTQAARSRAGFFFAFSAYFSWGLMVLFWKLTGELDPIEVTAHRALWSLPVAGVVLWAIGRTSDIVPALKSPRKLGILFICSILITLNWGVFIWAVAVGRTLETALAYYFNPLITVMMGFVFLGDRFNRPQMLAILIAVCAVVYLTVIGGAFPWLSLFLACTFALYGLLRKTVEVGPTQGFLIEILLIFPFALAYTIWLEGTGQGDFFNGNLNWLLLILAGPATAMPLILYANGAKRLRLSTLGMMQYIAPSIIFLISLFIFGEELKPAQLTAFIMIWTALALYSWSLFNDDKK